MEVRAMKREDIWMIAIVAFCIVWVTLFGIGTMG